MGSGIGSMVFPYVLNSLIKIYGWKGCLLIAGGIVANLIPCFAVCIPVKQHNVIDIGENDIDIPSLIYAEDGRKQSQGNSKEYNPYENQTQYISNMNRKQSTVTNTSSANESLTVFTKVKQVLKNKVFAIYVLGMCLLIPSCNSFTQSMFDLLQNSKGFDNDTTILLFFAFNASSTVARLLPGVCKQAIPSMSVLLIPFLYGCFGVVSFALFPSAVTFTEHVVLMSASGVMLGGAVSAISVTPMKLIGSQNYSIALGFTLMAVGVCNLFAGPLSGNTIISSLS